jgi:phage anti-repressor protein
MKNIDYIVMRADPHMYNTTTKINGRPSIKILLTVDCFKLLCMRSKTAKSEEVRQYYLELEKLVDKYKDYIIEQKYNKIKILENDLKKDIYPVGNYSYIIQEKDELGKTFFRIGQSGNLKDRMANHNSSSIHKKIISFQIKTDNKLQFESCLRNSMYNFRYKSNKDYYKRFLKGFIEVDVKAKNGYLFDHSNAPKFWRRKY